VKQIFVHCGLHKTGTTALQSVFMRKAEALAYWAGILYPKAGRLDTLGGGHHNIAWQVARDRRFDINRGTLATLADEINGFDGNVVLSSEDFESILSERPLIDRFIAALSSTKAELTFVVYLRNQMSYCESIFVENLAQNIGEEYPRYVRDITRNGYLSLSDWFFQFDYAHMLSIAAGADIRLIVRNFHAIQPRSVVADFLEIAGIDPVPFADSLEYRSNERLPTLQALRFFCRNRLGRALGEREVQAVKMVSEVIGGRKLTSLPATRAAFRNNFAGGNQKVCATYNLPAEGLDLRLTGEAGADPIFYETLFSFELQTVIAGMRNMLRDGKPEAAQDLAAAFVKSI
jgi:hypothetical protein